MTTWGRSTLAALTCAGVALLGACTSSTPKHPTSDQIKASAQAALDKSLQAGRGTRATIQAKGYDPSTELCKAVWDKKSTGEQQELLYAAWLTGCTEAGQ